MGCGEPTEPPRRRGRLSRGATGCRDSRDSSSGRGTRRRTTSIPSPASSALGPPSISTSTSTSGGCRDEKGEARIWSPEDGRPYHQLLLNRRASTAEIGMSKGSWGSKCPSCGGPLTLGTWSERFECFNPPCHFERCLARAASISTSTSASSGGSNARDHEDPHQRSL